MDKKVIMKQIYVFIAMLLAMPVFYSCSSSEEPEVEKSGEEIAARFKSLLTGTVSESWLIPEEDSDNKYMALASDSESARKLCMALVDDDRWSVADRVYLLPDQYGRVTVTAGETEGIYLTMALDIKDMKPCVIDIVSSAYINDSNLLIYPGWSERPVSCVNCGWTAREWPGKCPVCNCTQHKETA